MYPSKLTKGDKVALVASARKVSLTEIQYAINTLENWGLRVVLGKNIFHSENQFSGSDNERAEDLQQALDDTSIKAILFARGGYGTVRIIDALDFSNFQKSPKWIIGFSDITILHAHIEKHFNIVTLHAPMAFNFEKTAASILERMQSVLFGSKQEYVIPAQSNNRKGIAEGKIIGGNLSILYSLLGSESDMDMDGKIVFLEDLDEYLYHVDRMLLSLKRNGKLKNLAGLVIGGMSDMKDNTIPFGKTAEEIILDAVKEYKFPVAFGFPAGHLAMNYPLILGDIVQLNVEEQVRLTSISGDGRS